MNRVPLSGLLFLAACSGDDPPTSHSSVPDHTGPITPPSFDGFLPVGFGVLEARFAVDAQGAAVGWTNAAGDRVPATLTLTLVDDTWSGGPTDTNHCQLTWTWSDPIPPEVDPATPAFARWNPTGSASARLTETCSPFEFSDRWLPDPVGVISSWQWGAGVGPLDAGVRESLERSFGDDFPRYEPYIAGGGFWWDGLRERENLVVPDEWRKGWVDTGVVYAYELDANGREVVEGGFPVQLLAADLPSGDGVVPGRYELQGTTLLTPATALIPAEE